MQSESCLKLFFCQFRIANPICDELKSDIFSLGLMCLEMASMESLEGVYDWENYVIEEVKVE